MYLPAPYKIVMRYDHVNLTGTGQNITTTRLIFDKFEVFPPILSGQTYSNNFTATGGDGFIPSNFPNATTEIDWYKKPYAVEYFANFTVSGMYSLDLLGFRFTLTNFSVGHLP